jgi:hypothetical protein
MITILVLLAATLVLELLTPFWWWIMAVPFAYGATAAPKGGKAFLAGFGAAGLLWLGGALCFYLTGSRLIAARMAAMFKVGDARLLILAAGLVAALAAGLAGYAGYALKRLFKAPKGKMETGKERP